ncbi:hypothetical protein HPB49_016042 [Dermacentor silvarum]|uniref:Uncharacterized protein n=1 Tax=Dermacentor silvarum TaxID=543639 RepID=A0ACB8CLS2_DERSI|nr:hypothetical protein HPB49_016042 [Dermacentor silvarum]
MRPPVATYRKSSGAFQGEPRGMVPQPPALHYMGKQPAQHNVTEPSAQLIGDKEDLWSDRVQEIISAHMSSLKPIEKDDREKIRATTTGPADNKNWHDARVGRLTASLFKGGFLYTARTADTKVTMVRRAAAASHNSLAVSPHYGALHTHHTACPLKTSASFCRGDDVLHTPDVIME